MKWFTVAAVLLIAAGLTIVLVYRLEPPPPSQLMRFNVSFNGNVRIAPRPA